MVTVLQELINYRKNIRMCAKIGVRHKANERPREGLTSVALAMYPGGVPNWKTLQR